MGNTICIIISIVIYLIAMLYIGIRASKENKNTDDFYLGGRKLGPLVTAMSAEASDMSSWLLMGLPGVAYVSGLADATWTAIGLAIGTYVNWLITAKRIRHYTEATNSITIPEFFSNRFGDKKRVLSIVSAIIIIIFFIPYTASGFAACGKLFHTIFGMNYTFAMILSAAVIVLYCAFGGFLAASLTDLVQSIVMTIALFIILGVGEAVVGGFDHVIANVQNLPGYLSLTNIFDAATNSAKDYSFLNICSMLAWGLGYFGMPHVLLRFMAIEDSKKLKTSRRVASVWVVISLAAAVMIGVVGYSLSKNGAIPTLDASTSETVIVQIASFIASKGYIAALIAGLILAGILAATMSTADSQLIAASSSVTQDIIAVVNKKPLSEKKSMLIARVSVIIISIIAIFLALDPNSSVFTIVSFAWAGFGATFGPVVLCALFWKRATKQGVLAGMVVGAIVVFAWKYGIAQLGGAWAIYELLPAFLCALFTIIIVSLLTKKPDQEILDKFEEVKAMK